MTKGVVNPGVIMTFILYAVTLQMYLSSQVASQVSVYKLFTRRSAAEVSLSSQLSATYTECLRECVLTMHCNGFCHNSSGSTCHLAGTSDQPYHLEDSGSHFVCFVDSCPEDQGYERHQRLCVKLYTSPLEYLEATARCAQDGAHLLHFKTDVDRAAMMEFVALQRGVAFEWWIGADDLASEGHYVWRSDGTALGPDAMWSLNEPNNSGDEDCVAMFTNAFKMNDLPCSTTLQFVCQVDP